MKKRPLIILTGPTAVGKTAASIGLAKAIGGEIISADSMQVYRHMDIGSAKITTEEMQGVPHYLVDVLEPEEPFSVVRFQEMAKEAVRTIYSRGKIPIVVGGTGFYIQALLYDIDFTENNDDMSYREQLEQTAAQKGAEYLHGLLKEIDPEAAAQIHPHNVKRVIRQGRRSPSTMPGSVRRNRPTIQHILSSRTTGSFSMNGSTGGLI